MLDWAMSHNQIFVAKYYKFKMPVRIDCLQNPLYIYIYTYVYTRPCLLHVDILHFLTNPNIRDRCTLSIAVVLPYCYDASCDAVLMHWCCSNSIQIGRD